MKKKDDKQNTFGGPKYQKAKKNNYMRNYEKEKMRLWCCRSVKPLLDELAEITQLPQQEIVAESIRSLYSKLVVDET